MEEKTLTFADYEKVKGTRPIIDALVEKVDYILSRCNSIRAQGMTMNRNATTKVQIQNVDYILDYVSHMKAYLSYYPTTEMAKYFWVIKRASASKRFQPCCPKYSVVARVGVNVEVLKGELQEINEVFGQLVAKIKELYKD